MDAFNCLKVTVEALINVTKDFFQINAVLLNIFHQIIMKYISFNTNMKQQNCYLSIKSSY